MSKFTTEVRYICEMDAGLKASVGLDDIDRVVKLSAPKVFLDSYPIFDVNYKSVLEEKILKHYYTREIGYETISLWKFKLRVKMNEIMPYYNQQYKSALIQFSPFDDTNITTTHETSGTANVDGTGKVINESGNVSKNKNLFSNTPQGSLHDVEEMSYLTDATITDGNTTSNSQDDSENHTNSSTTEKYLENIKGKRGSQNYSELILKYRETFTNIDMLVIGELKDLFMGLW